ncbi:MAG TPA: hypothetical protein VKU02_34105 [Gemmataceae bacterium]|nr:hypothetical protein [Gemmataceae bacterium]
MKEVQHRPTLAENRLLEQEAIHQSARKANPRHPDFRQALCNNRAMLTETLLGLGDHAAAADTAAQRIQAATDPANDVYNAACFLSRCAPLAKQDP